MFSQLFAKYPNIIQAILLNLYHSLVSDKFNTIPETWIGRNVWLIWQGQDRFYIECFFVFPNMVFTWCPQVDYPVIWPVDSPFPPINTSSGFFSANANGFSMDMVSIDSSSGLFRDMAIGYSNDTTSEFSNITVSGFSINNISEFYIWLSCVFFLLSQNTKFSRIFI